MSGMFNVDLNKLKKSFLFSYDELKLYFGEDYVISDKIKIHQPTIGEICEWGEQRYYSMIFTLTCIPSDMKSRLDDIGINYMDLSDFELFRILCRTFTSNETSILFGDLDFSKFQEFYDKTIEQPILYDVENDIRIDELVYYKIVDYLRKIHNIHPKVEKALNETTRKILIQLDRDKIAKAQKETYKSQLKELISAMMRYPGFKYKKNELKECGLYEFMDTVQGAQIYISSTALISGSYSGMCDMSKVNKDLFNWMRSSSE